LRLAGAPVPADSMSMDQAPPSQPPAGELLTAALGAFLALLVAAAIVGAVLSANLLSGAGHGAHGAETQGVFRVAQDVPTSFGFVAVEHAETRAGLTAKQLAGAVHGIANFVGRDQALVQASVTLTNTTGRPVRYHPGQFRLAATRGNRIRRYGLAKASIQPGELQPDAAVDARLSFAVPRDGSDLAVEFADPAGGRPIVIDLGRRISTATKADRRSIHGHPAAVPAPPSAPAPGAHQHE
jgi:hypothetical protein